MWRYKPERQHDLENWAQLWECGLWGWSGVRFFFFSFFMMKYGFCLPKHCKTMPNAGRMALISSYLGKEIVKSTMWHPLPSEDDIYGQYRALFFVSGLRHRHMAVLSQMLLFLVPPKDILPFPHGQPSKRTENQLSNNVSKKRFAGPNVYSVDICKLSNPCNIESYRLSPKMV